MVSQSQESVVSERCKSFVLWCCLRRFNCKRWSSSFPLMLFLCLCLPGLLVEPQLGVQTNYRETTLEVERWVVQGGLPPRSMLELSSCPIEADIHRLTSSTFTLRLSLEVPSWPKSERRSLRRSRRSTKRRSITDITSNITINCWSFHSDDSLLVPFSASFFLVCKYLPLGSMWYLFRWLGIDCPFVSEFSTCDRTQTVFVWVWRIFCFSNTTFYQLHYEIEAIARGLRKEGREKRKPWTWMEFQSLMLLVWSGLDSVPL